MFYNKACAFSRGLFTSLTIYYAPFGGERRNEGMRIECVAHAAAQLGEGTLWDPDRGVVWWVDIRSSPGAPTARA